MISLELHKAYGTLDRDRCLEILGGEVIYWDLGPDVSSKITGTDYKW